MSAFTLLLYNGVFPNNKKLYVGRFATTTLKKVICCFRRFLEPRDIFGEGVLNQCALTRSSKDSCFQAHLLGVSILLLPFPLKIKPFQDVSRQSGLFPSRVRTFAPILCFFMRTVLFGVFLKHVYFLLYHASTSALPELLLSENTTSIVFAKNQLSPRLVGLSPLSTRHRRLLPQTCVRPSTICYYAFSLHMERSRGFGSYKKNTLSLLKTRFRFASTDMVYTCFLLYTR